MLKNLLIFITLFTGLHADNLTRKKDDVQFSIELGAKTDFWNPGVSGNVLGYDTEGLLLGLGKFKVKIYDTEVLSLEKFQTFKSSTNQNNLLAEYQDDKKHESTIDGVRLSLHLMKMINYFFDKDWLTGLNYEYNTRNFMGVGTLLQNSIYWYGNINGGVLNRDYSQLEKGNKLLFQTKFAGHKLFYQFDNIVTSLKGSYISVGAFDETWSKPTFIGDSGLNGELPIIFDSNYYSKGITVGMGITTNSLDIKTYVDYGLDNSMKIIQKDSSSVNYSKDITMYMMGFSVNYRFADVYSNRLFNTDILIGTNMQYSKITEDQNKNLDAETLYGVNFGIEVTF